ncbi:hypothetical protein TVAG_491490 [Trichomonas vaginalis G3]|uniref:Uncharacterized protein n=1 Tax=Trichomonas vaginalis (strain ATCC PRA-98 / G3) TaxID=412133 RepID=A2EAI1_TRIV3|nr:hypothetical protein TVAGG3_1005920 [Trichomonas vaginalis G3]EAY10292.1 hypothetical protein TVAG_491490 [Trichomonas vaginalis G3]KAI5491130.1 hypothetical protein TVAGG3_1005920 [Trichomonas vaginalis G3]|eukprot:XP_001322515.1 hypothetical protein [Trichomonas vaginalis G3]
MILPILCLFHAIRYEQKTLKKPKVVERVSNEELDIKVALININHGILERDYGTSDLNSLIDQICNEFHLEWSLVSNYFSRVKYASLSKTIMFRLDMDQADGDNRAGYLAGTVFKVTKMNGWYTVNVRQASVKGTIRR